MPSSGIHGYAQAAEFMVTPVTADLNTTPPRVTTNTQIHDQPLPNSAATSPTVPPSFRTCAPPYNDRLHDLETNLYNTNDRLSRLEECCGKLAESTKSLEVHLFNINNNMNTKLTEMSVAISKLNISTDHRSHKLPKPHDGTVMDLDLL